MSNIVIITAANLNFKEMVNACIKSTQTFGYKTLVYDLGGLNFGNIFNATVGEIPGAKIPSKPFIVLDAMTNLKDNDILVWLDADTIMWDRIDEIDSPYDIGVTVRKPKSGKILYPINAGVLFFRKTSNTLNFVKEWSEMCRNSHSDQHELNNLCNITPDDLGTIVCVNGTKIKVFDSEVYNNFYFTKSQLNAKIIHYKTKHRDKWPGRNEKPIKNQNKNC